MLDKSEIILNIKRLLAKYQGLSSSYKKSAAEPKAEEYVIALFKLLGWDSLSEEVIPQQKIKRASSSDRVDYSFKIAGFLKPSMYVEVKRFARNIDNPEWVKQAVEYGKNGGARWVILTNFNQIRVFNSDFYADMGNAELFEKIDIAKDLEIRLEHILLLSREACFENKLDTYAKLNKKWKESANIEDLLTETIQKIRKKWVQGIYEQNWRLFEEEEDIADAVDQSVQMLFDRIVFCRILEDNGVDEDRKLRHEYEKWEGDKRTQFYTEYLVPFFEKMGKIYDSSIFKSNGINDLRIKNEDFIEGLLSFYTNEEGLNYHFDAIPTDVLGHVYENYLSYKARITGKKIEIEEEMYERKQSGIYFTPEFLVNYIIENTLGKRLAKCKTSAEVLSIKVLDPACGSGTFLIRAYDEFKRWYEKNPSARQAALSTDEENGMEHFLDAVLENCIYGIDLDPRAAELARLNLFMRAVHNPKMLPQLHIISKNSLVSDPEFKDDTPFIFEKNFPMVYEEGGFDVIITNPPWEKWKPNSKEFFEPYYPGFKALPAQEAKKLMQEMLAKRPYLKKKWTEYNAHYESLSTLFRDEKNFQFQSADVMGRMVSGDLDLYKIFTERIYQLLKQEGLAGIVIPSGIYTDLGSKGIRTMLFDKCKIESLYGFENRKPGLFPAVDSRYKPVLITFEKGHTTTEFPCGFFLHTQEDLARAISNPTIMDVNFVKKANPLSWNIIEIKSKFDYDIVKKMLKYPHLSDEVEGTWKIETSSGFHMTNDSHLFKPHGDGIPMLEGKNIHQYTNKWKEAPKPKYSITEKDIINNLPDEKMYYKDYWLAYRLIASSTNERTMISTIVPPGYVCGNSIAIVKMNDLKAMCFLCGVLNSFVVDYLLRQKVSANVNMFYFLELPIPRIKDGQYFDAIAKKAVQLVATNTEFTKLKSEFGMISPVVDEQDRQSVKNKIDALVAKMYGINEEELKHILSQFPIVDNKIKEQVLNEYSRL
jgi:Alw26I/Eco31I/Esp3I family type II restriction m6 adenine DNA methyltransferase